jgi:hypothetical protein
MLPLGVALPGKELKTPAKPSRYRPFLSLLGLSCFIEPQFPTNGRVALPTELAATERLHLRYFGESIGQWYWEYHRIDPVEPRGHFHQNGNRTDLYPSASSCLGMLSP